VFADIDTDLSDKSQPPTAGRHPLPSPEAFAAAMSRLGIGDDTPVVAYDDTAGSTAGRLVVMLRAIGHSAAMLDGGMAAWSEPLVPETVAPASAGEARFTPVPWPADRFATVAEVTTLPSGSGTILLDARAGERYRGEVEPIDPRAGHIPGAVNAPWAANLDPTTGRFRSPVELRALYESIGVNDETSVICSCGSGVTACTDVLAIEAAGFPPPRLFVPSWSGWCHLYP
jgi:thiosulfate/3-mercaptopyruvate sulfurtransferase